jgi:hypothetical protein
MYERLFRTKRHRPNVPVINPPVRARRYQCVCLWLAAARRCVRDSSSRGVAAALDCIRDSSSCLSVIAREILQRHHPPSVPKTHLQGESACGPFRVSGSGHRVYFRRRTLQLLGVRVARV